MIKIELEEWQVKNLRNYFGENDKTQTAHWAYKLFNEALKQQCDIPIVGCSKITALVTYWKWQEGGHAMLDDTKNKTTKIVEVEKLVDINKMFTNLIDVKILK